MSKLLSTYKIIDLELKNRVVMAPMCMDSADENGMAQDWHHVHYVNRAIGGVGLIILEATAVESRGRITDKDLGIWSDSHIPALQKMVTESKKHGAKMGIQLAHAGRKCEVVEEDIIAPSAIAFSDEYETPREMTVEDIQEVIQSFKVAAKRALEAGFDMIELHGAHGYLINEFISPLTNHRNDAYGGSVENRGRFLVEVVQAVREVWPSHLPVFLRVSAKEYLDGGSTVEEIAQIINLAKGAGLDVIDVSTGGVVPAKIHTYPGYQLQCGEQIRKLTNLPVIVGGLVTQPTMAEEILENDRGDLIYLGRELLRNPYWVFQASKELQYDVEWPVQYLRSKAVRKGGF